MKKKRLLANIITLVFAISVMSFGIYAAYSANLTMTGTVGFIAHECEVEVLGTITNAIRSKDLNFAKVTDKKYTVSEDTWYDKYSQLDANGDSTNTPVAIANENVEWVFGDVYFDDIYTEADGAIQDVIITLQVTNKSVYPIVAEININDIDVPEGMTFDAPPTTDLAVNETKDIVMTVSLVDDQAQNTIEITTVSGTSLDLSNCVVTFNKAGATTGENPETPDTPEDPEEPEQDYVAPASSGWVVTESGTLIAFPTLDHNNGSTTIRVPSAVELNGEPVEVVSIGSGSKVDNANLYTNISLSNTVTKIGNLAFSNCSNIAKIKCNNVLASIGYNAFEGCTNLTEITLPNSLTSLGSSAFKNCTNLQSINLKSSAASNKYFHAFEGCTSLTTVNIDENLTSLGNYIFYNCTNLKTVNFGTNSKLTSLKGNTFYGCTSLIEISLPNSISEVGGSDFYGCINLTSINIPESLTILHSSTFANCSSLTSITLPENIEDIRNNVFEGCSSLEEITIPSSVTSLSSNVFLNCTKLKSVTLKSSVDLLSESNLTFVGCTALTIVNIDENLTKIGNYLFKDCTSITTVNIPENSSLENIGTSTFNGCTGLTEIILPSKVIQINGWSFQNCTNLATVYINSSEVESSLNMSNILDNAQTIYVSTNISNHNSWIIDGFTYDSSLSNSNYSCYVK